MLIDFEKFNPNLGFDQFIELFNNNEIDSKGRVQRFTLHRRKKEGKFINEGFHFGSRMSDRLIRCYDKKEEMKDKPKKYIEMFWKKNGLKSDNVYRWEIQLNSKYFKKLRELDKESKEKEGFLDVFKEGSIIESIKTACVNYWDFYNESEVYQKRNSKIYQRVFQET